MYIKKNKMKTTNERDAGYVPQTGTGEYHPEHITEEPKGRFRKITRKLLPYVLLTGMIGSGIGAGIMFDKVIYEVFEHPTPQAQRIQNFLKAHNSRNQPSPIENKANR